LCSNGRQLLLVATCHIHWDPDYSDVKLIQTMMLMNELKNITEEVQALSLAQNGDLGDADQSVVKPVPLILCGDFNSLPDSGMTSIFSVSFIGRPPVDEYSLFKLARDRPH
jgi:CCR4-NOT transcription complex subunit 6